MQIYLISKNVFKFLEKKEKLPCEMKSIKIFLRQIKMLTTQTREFIALLYDIIDGPNGICMKETKIPFDFYKMFLTL